MIGLIRTIPIRGRGRSLVPLIPIAVALAIAVLGAMLYLELVTVLLELAG